jgi:hypothetical protein
MKPTASFLPVVFVPFFLFLSNHVAARPQTTAPSPTVTSGSSSPATYTVDVGKAEHSFTPDIIIANVGDIISMALPLLLFILLLLLSSRKMDENMDEEVNAKKLTKS